MWRQAHLGSRVSSNLMLLLKKGNPSEIYTPLPPVWLTDVTLSSQQPVCSLENILAPDAL